MAQNEMKAKAGLPERIRSSEWLGGTELTGYLLEPSNLHRPDTQSIREARLAAMTQMRDKRARRRGEPQLPEQ